MSNLTSGLRFPAALQVFPLLRRFPSLRPRRLAEVPVGNLRPIPDEHLQACIRHLYHDIGVLAYAGCTDDQIGRMGDLISRTISSGGPGAMITMLDNPGKTERRRLQPLDEQDLFEAYDVAHAGIIKPRVLLQIADSAFRAHIKNHIMSNIKLDPSSIQLRERNVHMRGIPSPKGIVHTTVSGRRILSVDCFTSVEIQRPYGILHCEMQLFSGGGKAEYVGACRIDYTMLQFDKAAKTMKSLFAKDIFQKEEWGKDAGRVREAAKRVIKRDMLPILWVLEDEVYGERADRLVRYDKVGLDGWRDREKEKKKGKKERKVVLHVDEEDPFRDLQNGRKQTGAERNGTGKPEAIVSGLMDSIQHDNFSAKSSEVGSSQQEPAVEGQKETPATVQEEEDDFDWDEIVKEDEANPVDTPDTSSELPSPAAADPFSAQEYDNIPNTTSHSPPPPSPSTPTTDFGPPEPQDEDHTSQILRDEEAAANAATGEESDPNDHPIKMEGAEKLFEENQEDESPYDELDPQEAKRQKEFERSLQERIKDLAKGGSGDQ